MWNLKESNQVVGIQDKVNSFKKHLQAVYHIKPRIKVEQPFKPTFSLSKFNNKYHRFNTLQLQRQNLTLISHLNNITTENKFNTFLQIPKTVPSNKETFKCFKSRQRKRQRNTIQKQNQKILSKISNINSQYSKQFFDKDWKQAIKYKKNITKKQLNPDFFQLAKQSFLEQNNCSTLLYLGNVQSETKLRPKTALPR